LHNVAHHRKRSISLLQTVSVDHPEVSQEAVNTQFKIAQEVEQRVRKVGGCLTAVNEQDYYEKEACCAQEREIVDDFLVASTFNIVQ
jgi:hypothetical protein